MLHQIPNLELKCLYIIFFKVDAWLKSSLNEL